LEIHRAIPEAACVKPEIVRVITKIACAVPEIDRAAAVYVRNTIIDLRDKGKYKP